MQFFRRKGALGIAMTLAVCLGVSRVGAQAAPVPTIELARGPRHHAIGAHRAEDLPPVRAGVARLRRRHDSRQRHHRRLRRRVARRPRPATPIPIRRAGVGIRIDGGRNVRRRATRVVRGYKVGLARARHAQPHARRATTSATTGSRGSSASSSTRASSTGCRTTRTSTTSGCASARASISRTCAAARSAATASSRAWKA